MRLKTLGFSLAAFSFCFASPASADNIADCEIVILQTVEDESGRGGAQVASYGPADEFLGSVYGENTEVFNKVGGLPIQAVMCKRIDIVPTKNDFKILATGIPLFLSQSFDSQSSDLISLFYKDGEFRHTYSGPGLTEETQGLIETRLTKFNEMEHGLAAKELELKTEEEAVEAKEDEAIDVTENNKAEESSKDTDIGDKPMSDETGDEESPSKSSDAELDRIDALAESAQEDLPKALEALAETIPASSTEEIATPLEAPLESE